MKAELVERTFQLGKQHWKVDAKGNWFVLMWGWGNYASMQDRQPRYTWEPITKDRVPKELL